MPLVDIHGLYDKLFSYFLTDHNTFCHRFLFLSNTNISSVLISLYSFPSLNMIIKLPLDFGVVSHMKIVKRWISETNVFGQHDYSILRLLAHVNFLIALFGYVSYPFFHNTLSALSCFFPRQVKKVLVATSTPWMLDNYLITTNNPSIGR